MGVRFAVYLCVLLAGILIAPVPGVSRAEDGRVFETDGGDAQAWLGVSIRDLTADAAKEAGLPKAEGALITRVVKKSPADSAGLRKGDVIIQFNERIIYEADDLVRAVRKTEPGTTAKITVMRNGSRKEIVTTLRRSPRKRLSLAIRPPEGPKCFLLRLASGSIGLRLMQLPPQLAKYFDAPEGKGVLVTQVREGSVAEKAGFKAGDVILKIDDTSVERVSDVRRTLRKYSDGEKITVEILRKGSRSTLTFAVEERKECGEIDLILGDDVLSHIHGGLEIDDLDIDGLEKIQIPLPQIDIELDDLHIEVEELREQLERWRIELEKLLKSHQSTKET